MIPVHTEDPIVRPGAIAALAAAIVVAIVVVTVAGLALVFS